MVNSKAFFQNNLAVTELLCRQLSSWIRASNPSVFYDLYAGVGTFSILCAQKVGRVICVEENPYAVSALRMNREEKMNAIEIFPGKA